MSDPVTDLVVPKGVQPHWLPGAQVLVTFQSTKLGFQETRIIQSVKNYDNDSVVLRLDASIPNLVPGEISSVQVALMSRNIVVNGGRLTVYRTPAVIQTIHGVRFQNLTLLTDDPVDRHVSALVAIFVLPHVVLPSQLAARGIYA